MTQNTLAPLAQLCWQVFMWRQYSCLWSTKTGM